MATTDSRLALASLEGMREAGVAFALLHGLERLRQDQLSDVDIVIAENPGAVVRRSMASWLTRGMMPVVVWPYDIGGTATVFLATPDASEGVQLDMLHDPAGVGKYGIKSGALLASAGSSASVPTVSDIASLIYQWQKRTVKRQAARLDELTRLALAVDARELLAMSEAVTGSSRAAERMLRSEPASRAGSSHPLLQGSRLAQRVVRPIGFWAHTAQAEIGVEMARRMSRFLVGATTQPTPPLVRQPAWWATAVMPIRLRPGVFVSTGPLPRWRPPDGVLSASPTDGDAAARQLTSCHGCSHPVAPATRGGLKC